MINEISNPTPRWGELPAILPYRALHAPVSTEREWLGALLIIVSDL
ncbi:hypothetical protein [Microcoleus sp. FACHB-672]|nr:hypothetical protein [Microcoleus sp. FACHB-672]MBD2041033.1 hypothetical protein [Microcoleus sp. FACHB-672]